MASNEPIERLYVKIEADVRELLQETDRAVDKAERRLSDLDKKAKRVGRFQGLRDGFQRLALAAARASAAIGLVTGAIALMVRTANESLRNLRAERAFRNLAASMGQSSNDILAAVTKASQGTISEMEAISVANDALLLGVARTPEEFEKMARAAVVLGRAKGLGPLESILTFINAAGRRATEVLDNLGLTLGEVNAEMERLARLEFGMALSQLSQVQRNMLFTQAAIEVATKKAEQLGGAIDDMGTSMEQQAADWKNLKQELGEIALILINVVNEQGKASFQGETFLQRMVRGAKDWQNILIQIVAILTGLDAALFKVGRNLRAILMGDMPLRDIGEGIGDEFVTTFQNKLEQLQTTFQDIVDPESMADGVLPMAAIDEVEDRSDDLLDIMDGLTTEMIDATEERQDALEELEKDHAERMADIAADGAKRRLKIDQDYQRDLAELARDTERRRAEIFRDTQRDLEELARDTNEALNDEREDFQTEERRETEDHLRAMRRLTEDYLFDLDDAVKERDARAVVDLQRRFALESQRREEDFSVNQSRDREDQDQRLREIRENEARRREEILASQAQELADLMIHEAERRADIEASRQEQIARLDEQLAEQRARENENYAERKADLEAALKERLAAIAKELADEEKVNEEGARRILTALNRYFGAGGEIDKLMDDFVSRRSQRMRVEISFEASTQGAQEGLGSTLPGGSGYGRIPRFQHGGTLLARKPTLAMFGEAGPEVAQFTPLGQGRGGGQPRRIQIEFSGSAPPGIRGTERDQIANVLLSALHDTGVMER
jgi:hypothetical protein